MILFIAPRLPPAACGVGAYSYRLAQSWPHAEHIVHLVVDGASGSRQTLPQLDIVDVGHSRVRLLRELTSHEPAVVILHYASRGYHRYGTPLWLSRAINQWKKNVVTADLVVMFHEVPAPLPLHTHHGVIYRINRHIINELCKCSSIVLTNTVEHALRLHSICKTADVHCVPVPSNILVSCNDVFPFEHRIPTDFLIFGLPFTQLLTVKSFASELALWASEGYLHRLHLVGPPSNEIDRLLMATMPIELVVRHGVLPDVELSSLLLKIGFCLTQATEYNYTKSATFMAFASHGCPTVAKISLPGFPFNLLVQPSEVGKHDYSGFAQRSNALREWYFCENDWPIVASKIASLLANSREIF
jgi:hypothetical protein